MEVSLEIVRVDFELSESIFWTINHIVCAQQYQFDSCWYLSSTWHHVLSWQIRSVLGIDYY